jgi:hypothetical protein
LKSEVNALTLVFIFIAASLAPTIAPEHSIFAQPLVGAVLLVVLFSYDREGHRNVAQSLGFAGVAGYCVAHIVHPLLAGLVLSNRDTLPWFSIIWIVSALILWAVDISRMGSRAAAQPYLAAPSAQPPVIVRQSAQEEPVRVQPAFQAPPPPPRPPVRPSSATSLFSQPMTPPRPPEAPRPSEEIPTMPVSVPQPEPIQSAPVPPPNALPVSSGGGKPTQIYLNLVGEGLAVLRSVQAEHVGKDYYLIVEPVPPGESWEFQPGQVVRCQKRKLSSGRALVAVEEAPRAS